MQMNKEWSWVGRFVAVIVVALILAAAIGSMDLFAKTFVISGKLSAAHLVRFLGYSTALGALWMLVSARRWCCSNRAVAGLLCST